MVTVRCDVSSDHFAVLSVIHFSRLFLSILLVKCCLDPIF
jgi:hypothetical protein